MYCAFGVSLGFGLNCLWIWCGLVVCLLAVFVGCVALLGFGFMLQGLVLIRLFGCTCGCDLRLVVWLCCFGWVWYYMVFVCLFLEPALMCA